MNKILDYTSLDYTVNGAAYVMAATAKTPNYTEEQTSTMVAAYLANPTQETVAMLSSTMARSVRSIVAKLSREKVYVSKIYVTKTGEAIIKKETQADMIGDLLDLTEADTSSLSKANKTALAKVLEAVQAYNCLIK
jgi:hypothetical protein